MREDENWGSFAEQSDEVLLAGLGAGDPDLAITFVRRFQRIVFGVAQAVTGDPATAEDVAQRAFEQAWRHASVYDSRRGSVRAWLTTITRNLAIDAVRARAAVPMDPADLPIVLAAMTDDPERVTVARDSAERLRQALAGLPVPQARAVAMSGIYGLTAAAGRRYRGDSPRYGKDADPGRYAETAGRLPSGESNRP